MGSLPDEITLQQFNQRVKQCLGIEHVQFVGNEESIVRHVAIACGAAAEFLRDAKQLGCDVLLYRGESSVSLLVSKRTRWTSQLVPARALRDRTTGNGANGVDAFRRIHGLERLGQPV